MTSSARRISTAVTSLRFRMVLITATAVTAMVALGGFLSVRAVQAEFMDAASWVARDHAAEVAEHARNGTLPGDMSILSDEGETLVQVVRDGRVISHTDNVPGRRAMPLPTQPPGSLRLLTVERLPVEKGPHQVAALGTATPRGPATVFVAVSTEDVADVTAAALQAGALGLVALVLPLSILLWVALGRTLAPVDAIRERADKITAEHLSERVPEPPRLDEIGRLARTINAMLARLDLSATEQRRFLADAAHELRSPIASMRAQLETNYQGKTLDDASTDDLRSDVLRMQALVDQLLLLARSDAGALQRRNVTVDLDDSVAAVLENLRLEDPRPGVAVDIRDVAPVQVPGDPVLLEQLVRNLLENAVRYAVRNVHVSLEQHGRTAVLTVDDDGPGIPEASRTEVFQRFARLDDSRNRSAGGVGLGLAIVADIARVHDGSVTVSESPSGGARFRVVLPVASSENLAPARLGPG